MRLPVPIGWTRTPKLPVRDPKATGQKRSGVTSGPGGAPFRKSRAVVSEPVLICPLESSRRVGLGFEDLAAVLPEPLDGFAQRVVGIRLVGTDPEYVA